MVWMNSDIQRGEVWLFDPDPVKGNEIGKKERPVIILSSTIFNKGPRGLVIIVPLTTIERGFSSHVKIIPKDGGVKKTCFAMCEQIRSISKIRLIKKWGKVENQIIITEISQWITDLLDL
jgi:mRNA interferase MazF